MIIFIIFSQFQENQTVFCSKCQLLSASSLIELWFTFTKKKRGKKEEEIKGQDLINKRKGT